jgi:hypothetical protein
MRMTAEHRSDYATPTELARVIVARERLGRKMVRPWRWTDCELKYARAAERSPGQLGRQVQKNAADGSGRRGRDGEQPVSQPLGFPAVGVVAGDGKQLVRDRRGRRRTDHLDAPSARISTLRPGRMPGRRPGSWVNARREIAM